MTDQPDSPRRDRAANPADRAVTRRLDLARRFAHEAGKLTLEFFQADNFQVEHKADRSPVTVADRQAEQRLRERIAEAFPGDAVVGEEFDDQPGTSGFRWILDPIDGTKSFISGVPLYGTLIGIEQGDDCLAGVIHIPALGETLWAARGHRAWHARGDRPPRPARVSGKTTLAEGLFVTSQIDSFDGGGRRDVYERLERTARITRTWGDCYGYLLVATGRAEVMVDPVMSVWDAAALLPIVEEAGGTFTDWQGSRTIHGGEGIGTNSHVLAEVLAMTSGR